MNEAMLEAVTELLEQAGLPAGEEYPGLPQPALDSPMAAVGLRELDAAEGLVRFSIRVLSPRILGGWCCQLHAARAVEALTAAGMACATAEMEYLSGSDCFCVTVTAEMGVIAGTEGFVSGQRQVVLCGGVEQAGVISLRAVRDLDRRLVGAHTKSGPVKVTPGSGGWQLELIQRTDAVPEEIQEPFTLTVRTGDREHRYTGCCWNETVWEHTRTGTKLTRRGFALEREEKTDG